MFQIILNGEKTSHFLPNCINLTLNQLHISARFGFGSGISSIYWTNMRVYIWTQICACVVSSRIKHGILERKNVDFCCKPEFKPP